MEVLVGSVGKYCVSREEINAHVDPLPFVPAIWMGFNRSRSDGYIHSDIKHLLSISSVRSQGRHIGRKQHRKV